MTQQNATPDAKSDQPAEVVTQYFLRPGSQAEFAAEQGKLSAALAGQPEYLGSDEHLTRHPGGDGAAALEWTVVRHFTTARAANAWVTGPQMRQAHSAISAISQAPPSATVLLEPKPRTANSVVVTSRVRPGSEEWFLVRQGQMQTAQARLPGYLGQRDQAPIPGVNPDWVAVVAFDSPEHLKAWLDSPERAAFLADTDGHIESYDCRPAASAFESWFTGIQTVGPPPPAWKFNAIVLLVLYPVVMAEIIWLNPALAFLGVSISTFIGNTISVAATGFILIPIASKLLSWWLVPDMAHRKALERRGLLVLLACYTLCVGFFQALTAAIGF